MPGMIRLALVLAVGLATMPLHAATSASTSTPQEQALLRNEMLAERETVAPGSQVVVAIRQHMAPGWHTYWRNPGNIGRATRLAWSLPAGWQAGEIAWPTPQVHLLGGMTNYVHGDGVLLPVTMSVPAGAPPGPVRITAQVDALLCKDVCIPSRDTVSLTLQVAARPGEPGAAAADIARALQAVRTRQKAVGVFERRGDQLVVALDHLDIAGATGFFPLEGQGIDSDAPMPLRTADGGATLTLQVKPGTAAADTVAGVIGFGGARPDAELVARRGTLPAWADARAQPSGERPGFEWLGFVVLGLVGGLLLNAMPCVFPILAGKAAMLAASAGDARRLRSEAIAYSWGCVAAFIALAAVLLVLRRMGHAAGWGFQLQSPAVVAALLLVMLASALSLAGLYDAGLWLQQRAGSVQPSDGRAGAFLTGALAAVVAAPCTAPMMAPAVGWAVTQPPAQALTVFGAIGLGLGLPFIVLALAPGAARWMPRPGAWMARLRQGLAFPMLGGVAWLLWVFVAQAGAARLPALLAAMIGLAFALWCWGVGQLSRRPIRWRLAAALVALAVVPWALVPNPGPGDGAAAGAKAVTAQAWSDEGVQEALSQGHPVLVDVTAAWCITCKANEALALDTDTVRDALDRHGARLLRADWTRPDPRIERLLSSHGRSGVPFYLLYTPDRREIALPQVLTPGLVKEALDNALRKES